MPGEASIRSMVRPFRFFGTNLPATPSERSYAVLNGRANNQSQPGRRQQMRGLASGLGEMGVCTTHTYPLSPHQLHPLTVFF